MSGTSPQQYVRLGRIVLDLGDVAVDVSAMISRSRTWRSFLAWRLSRALGVEA